MISIPRHPAAAMIFIGALFIAPALAEPPENADPELAPWFQSFVRGIEA